MIPPSATRVFEGLLFDVYHYEQEQFDGSSKTFERLRGPDGVQVIAVAGDKIVLIEDEQPGRAPMTGLPGGRIDPGEEPIMAAKRELLEETGYETRDWSQFAVYDEVPKIDWSFHYFIARGCTKTREPHVDDGGERITVRLVTFDDFIAEVTAPQFRAGSFSADMLRLRLEPAKLEEFRRRLFNGAL